MKKLSAILTVLALGSSTAAMADPDRWHDRDDRHDRYDRRGDYDRRVDEDRGEHNVPRDQWMQLTRLEFHDKNTVIDLDNVRVRTIELQSLYGHVDINGIRVMYSDGTYQWIPVRRALDVQHAPNLRFDVERGGVGVHALYVVGRGHAGITVIGAR